MARKDVHVVPDGGEWAVESSENGEQKTFRTQEEAVDFGRQMAKEEHAELFVHGADGEIRQRDSYGNDPFPPEG